MDKQLFIITKIKLLYLSLKAISLDKTKDIENKTLVQKEINYKLKTYNDKFFQNYYINQIQFVFIIYKLSQDNIIQQLAKNIIFSEKNKYKKNITAIKYLNKFKYLYHQNYNYYESNSLSIKIDYIAIINLYIIIKCYNTKSIVFLVKYLYIPTLY